MSRKSNKHTADYHIQEAEITAWKSAIKARKKQRTLAKFKKASAAHLKEIAELELLIPQLEASITQDPNSPHTEMVEDRLKQLRWRYQTLQHRAKEYTPEAQQKLESEIHNLYVHARSNASLAHQFRKDYPLDKNGKPWPPFDLNVDDWERKTPQ
jgi:phage-related minor tail protein